MRQELNAEIKKFQSVLKALKERDLKDFQVDKMIRNKLMKEGLSACRPKKILEIDTGQIIGVENVVNKIQETLKDDHQFISIEGESGTGKGSTAEKLCENINAHKFSLGEVFRYLTYAVHIKKVKNVESMFVGLEYRFGEKRLELWDKTLNVSKRLFTDLKSPALEAKIPGLVIKINRPVIEFIRKEIEKLKMDFEHRVIMEGRSHTLDFLPSDLRIKLVADPKIRAERRMNQVYDVNMPV